MLAVIVFILILGLLIFVHEMGHFLVAIRNGVKAEEFGFGFPPRILGLQFLTGKEHQKNIETESLSVEISDVKIGDKAEIIQETITKVEKEIDQINPVRKWCFIWGNEDGDSAQEKKDLKEAHKKRFSGGTIYSLNWIPLGGFVRIKGENGQGKDEKDSFASRSAWTRSKILLAGVIMNFILAWFLISLGFMIGAPEALDSETNGVANSKIQISGIIPDSPSDLAGFEPGDEIVKVQTDSDGQEINLDNVKAVQNYIDANKGREMILFIKRGNEILKIKAIPRVLAPEGQGPLGITLAETAIVRYSWYRSIGKGLMTTIDLVGAISVAFAGIIKNIFTGQGVMVDIAGPVGIAVLTKQVTTMGFIYILQFAALLSINLGIINALPFPALDGGRILFIIIEKIKGNPVSQKVEQAFHTVGFILLIMLLVLVTFRDVSKFIK